VIICGIFGLAEVVHNSVEQPEEGDLVRQKIRLRDTFLTRQSGWRRAGRSSGEHHRFFVGMIPAGGITTASFLAYLAEKAGIPTSEEFGKGRHRGSRRTRGPAQTRPRSAALPFARPGHSRSPTTAVMLAGFLMWASGPARCSSRQHADLVWGLISSKFIGNYPARHEHLPHPAVRDGAAGPPTRS